MLRNFFVSVHVQQTTAVLNEVLSLNAQEYDAVKAFEKTTTPQ